MPVYKGFDTPTRNDAAKLRQALNNASAALDQSARSGDAYSHYLDVWRESHPGKPDDPYLVSKIRAQNAITATLEQQIVSLEAAIAAPHMASRAEVAARNRKALKNLREPDQNVVLATIQGGFEGLGEGLGNVGQAAAGVITGAAGIVADTASGLDAATLGMYDEATGHYADARKRKKIAEAIDKKQLDRVEGITATEQGGIVRSLYESGLLAITGQSDKAIDVLANIPTDELAGLDFNNPNFSKNAAGLGINIAMMALGGHEPLLKTADALESQAARLVKNGSEKDLAGAARLKARALAYRNVAIAVKLVKTSPRKSEHE